MRLVTFELAAGNPRIGSLLPDGGILDLQDAAAGAPEFVSMLALIEAGPAAWQSAQEATHTAIGRFVRGAARRPAACWHRCRCRRSCAISCASRST